MANTSDRDAFLRDVASVLNTHGIDTTTGMPDHVLAEYVDHVLSALHTANKAAKRHAGVEV